ncbi:hypothetical protein BOX15_Mlig026715g2 [Macrostomum lignano]|uniref:Sel1 repeat-containing protein n=2 Tax=Macrostomum lignano TaxID=282301 RepID=A0A267F2L0_9PLAT|nr:hypothetical protein BOX15_Mlig026715g1 [Macrostomum lignano]PAA89334.1 hypothetical protein BOX15_Mlig026715g2 [Macrostomum lignano]
MSASGSQLRQRSNLSSEPAYQPAPDDDWDPSMPYGGKVFLARRKKPDPWWVTAIEITVLVGTACFAYYAYYYFDHLHFHVTKAYAHMGFKEAQHQIGQRYLHGKGVEQHHPEAMRWFHKAAEQGHPHASYNLAVGHLKGIQTELKRGDVRRFLHSAANQGIAQAHDIINEACARGACDD